MKALLFAILVGLGMLISGFTTRPAADTDPVLAALKSGNVGLLSRYFDNRIDIALPERSDNYSRSQAEMILKNFFSNNGGVTNFELRHKGRTMAPIT
ncbi:MAG: DUF4783 domain-containing protein [Flavihumibacter sp.]